MHAVCDDAHDRAIKPSLEEGATRGTGSVKADGARGNDLSRWEGNIVSKDSDVCAVRQDEPATAQRGNGRAALLEFEIELEHALADLRLNIVDLLPSRYVELGSDDEDNDAGGKLIEGVLIDDTHERIRDAFSNFTWPLQRALQRLRRAL
jgi:hypothetical protein